MVREIRDAAISVRMSKCVAAPDAGRSRCSDNHRHQSQNLSRRGRLWDEQAKRNPASSNRENSAEPPRHGIARTVSDAQQKSTSFRDLPSLTTNCRHRAPALSVLLDDPNVDQNKLRPL